jgi:glycosyltransferase involved in cell wall biosynthesis
VGELFEVVVTSPPDQPVYFIVPEAIDDPAKVSGGNVYDQHVRDGLRRRGFDVSMVPIADGQEQRVERLLSDLPHDSLVLVDGLIAVRVADTLADHAVRLRFVVLAHMVASSLADVVSTDESLSKGPAIAERERTALVAARRVIATSQWTRSELAARGLAEADRIVVAYPGTDSAPLSGEYLPVDARTADARAVDAARGGRLLCVGAVAPHKGHDLLVRALQGLGDINGWTCTIVGSLDAAPDFVAELIAEVSSADLADRVTFTDVRTGESLADAYGSADLLVAPSRSESYGMVVADALARGIPVLIARVGGLPEAVANGDAAMIVPPEDPVALNFALRQWLTSPAQRSALRAGALKAREAARSWTTTTDLIAATLNEAALTGSALPT